MGLLLGRTWLDLPQTGIHTGLKVSSPDIPPVNLEKLPHGQFAHNYHRFAWLPQKKSLPLEYEIKFTGCHRCIESQSSGDSCKRGPMVPSIEQAPSRGSTTTQGRVRPQRTEESKWGGSLKNIARNLGLEFFRHWTIWSLSLKSHKPARTHWGAVV